MKRNPIIIALIAVGLLATVLSAVHRYSAEARNRRVELVIDWTDAQQLANTTSVSINSVLGQLHDAGITSVAVNEDTLDALRVNGIVGYQIKGGETLLTFTPELPGQRDRVIQSIANKTLLAQKVDGPNGLLVNAPWIQIAGLPIGLDGSVVTTIRHSDLLIAPRLLNYTGVDSKSINWQLDQLRQQCGPDGLGTLIFAGTAVLGFRGAIRDTAEALEARNMNYGSLEFGKMFGDDDLSRLAADHTVRVHSIGTDEMGTMDEPTAEERFVRGARERNIRVCYVRLFINGLEKDPDVIHANTEFIRNIVKAMKIAKLTVGPGAAHPFVDDPEPGIVSRLLMAAGIAAGIVLLLQLFTGIEGKAYTGAFLGVLLLCLVLALPGTDLKAREILALFSACTFPALGLCLNGLPEREEGLTALATLKKAFVAYCRMTLFSVAGVMFIVGLLNGRLFYLKVDSFLGVKLVMVAPLLLVGIYYGLGLSDLPASATWEQRRARLKRTFESIMSQKLLIGQILFGIVALAVLVLIVARSGNDPGVGVSTAELKMRALLDKYLLVRPRTKEFLLGHPALMLALAYSISGKHKGWVLLLLLVGAIGQASIVDTFCHLHTPLFLSVLRAGIGWLLGAAASVIVYLMIERMERRSGSSRVMGEPISE